MNIRITYRPLLKRVLICTLFLYQLGFSSYAYPQKADLVTKIFIDFKGKKPIASELLIRNDLAAAVTIAEKRLILEEIMRTHVFVDPGFERRLNNYFSGVFSTSLGHGSLLAPCDVAAPNPQPANCFIDDQALDFRDEMSMFVSKIISGRNEDATDNDFIDNFPGTDIRNIVKSSRTVMTPRTAARLDILVGGVDLKSSIGYGNIDQERVDYIRARPAANANNWYWVDRDPLAKGIAAGPGGSFIEKHSGILTVPAYYLRGQSHLARANHANSWLLCGSVYQLNAPESKEQKLINRAPCSGCHTVLEPLGSFFVNWRSKMDPKNTFSNFIYDANEWATNPPISSDQSIHSLEMKGSFRGIEGQGVNALANIILSQKDFGRCMAKHAWQLTLGRAMMNDEAGWADLLGERLGSQYNWDLRQVIIDIVLSAVYSKGE
jgi:hypothetical protein